MASTMLWTYSVQNKDAKSAVIILKKAKSVIGFSPAIWRLRRQKGYLLALFQLSELVIDIVQTLYTYVGSMAQPSHMTSLLSIQGIPTVWKLIN